MNIFFLDKSPERSAEYSFDCHIRSGLIETVAMMGFVYDDGDFTPWKWINSKNRYAKNPMTIWVGSTLQNFDWILQHSFALAQEFEFRFGKKHKCLEYLNWIALYTPIYKLPNDRFTEPPRCFGKYKDDIEITDDVVQDYRQYYLLSKRHLEKWTKRNAPDWWH